MTQETKLLIGKIAYILSNRFIKTELVKEDLAARRERRRQENEALQAELDKEHSRGWGYKAIDGTKVTWAPFNKDRRL